MYFKNIPDIQYDIKPINYPFSQTDYVIAKNFFKRYTVNKDAFSYSVFFKRYAIVEGDRPDSLAEKAYGDPLFDWVIILVNNIISPLFDWPLSDNALKNYCERRYESPYETIRYYKTFEVVNNFGIRVLQKDLIVDENFYNRPFEYWNGNQTVTLPGNQVSFPVSIFDDEFLKNEKRREIYLLKPEYLERFISDFRKQNLYSKSSDFINNKLKKTGV